jgi:NADPH:quinone reductase-like Zn-dependent oxidoreductase
MKAAVYEKYGPPEVVELRDVAKPTPKANEILIKIHATTVNSGDWRVRSMDVPTGFGLLARLALGITKPRQPILGAELAGVVEAIGTRVTQFKVGDPVFALTISMGCHAEYRCLREDAAVALKPANVSFDEAAALSFGGATALSFLRQGQVTRGEKVLVNGASGAVGVAAVQLAKHFGAHVTGVCSGANAELVRSLGADAVVDYTTTDFTKTGETYDVVVDTAGTAPFARSKASLKPGGRLLQILGGLPDLLRAPWLALTSDKKVIGGTAPERADDLRFLAELASKGEYKPVIDRRYPLEQIVEAHRYVDTGRKKGSVVITVGQF